MIFRSIVPAAIAAAMAFAPAAQAQETAGPVSLTTVIEQVETAADGSQSVVEALGVVPGDMLQFTNAFRNNSGQAIENFTLVNPVPADVIVAAESAANLEVSVDGGTVWGPLASLEIETEDGARRAAEAGDITHLRWIVAELAPEQSGEVSYRAVIR